MRQNTTVSRSTPATARRAMRAGHHGLHRGARRRAVKALRFAPTPFGAGGLDSRVGRATRRHLRDVPPVYPRAFDHSPHSAERRTAMEHLSMAPGVSVTIGRQYRQYLAFVTTAPDVFDSPGNADASARSVSGSHRVRRCPDSAREHATNDRPPGARRRDGARLAASQVPGHRVPVPAGRRPPGRAQHAAAVALATPRRAQRQSCGCMTHSSSVCVNRSRARELFKEAEHGRQDHSRTRSSNRPENSRMPSSTSATARSKG